MVRSHCSGVHIRRMPEYSDAGVVNENIHAAQFPVRKRE